MLGVWRPVAPSFANPRAPISKRTSTQPSLRTRRIDLHQRAARVALRNVSPGLPHKMPLTPTQLYYLMLNQLGYMRTPIDATTRSPKPMLRPRKFRLPATCLPCARAGGTRPTNRLGRWPLNQSRTPWPLATGPNSRRSLRECKLATLPIPFSPLAKTCFPSRRGSARSARQRKSNRTTAAKTHKSATQHLAGTPPCKDDSYDLLDTGRDHIDETPAGKS